MRRLRKIGLIALGLVIGVPVIAVVVVFVFLNTGYGRKFVSHEVGKLSGDKVRIVGLGGHFPGDIKARQIRIADAKGPWLALNQAELRWSATALLHRRLQVNDLTAQSIDVTRLPVPSTTKAKKSNSTLPVKSVVIRHIDIGRLNLSKAVAGQKAALHITGHVVAPDLQHVSLALNATSLIHPGHYQVAAKLTPKTVNATLSVHEPEGGIIHHFAHLPKVPQLEGPLALEGTLKGPRNDAALNLNLSLAQLQAKATGTVDLSQSTPGANITVVLPHLAPYAAIAKTQLYGHDVLHLVANTKQHVTDVTVQNTATITGGKAPLPKLLGHQVTLASHLTLAGSTITIHNLNLDAAAVTAAVKGTVSKQDVALDAVLHQPDLCLFDPKLDGHLEETAHITGPRTDLAMNAKVTGALATSSVPSGPFLLDVKARHLPRTPSGSVVGGGSLDGAPLALNIDFARAATGAVHLAINSLSWKSLQGSGVLNEAKGETLPDGDLHVAIAHLDDFATLAGITLAGSVEVGFQHKAGQPAALSVTAADLREGKNIAVHQADIKATLDHVTQDPAIDAKAVITGIEAPEVSGGAVTLTAQGTETALGIDTQAKFATLAGAPADLSLAAKVNGKTRVVDLDTMQAKLHGIKARLLHPAVISDTPETGANGARVSHMAVQNLALDLGGGTVTVNGEISPALNLDARIAHLPANIAHAADPRLRAKGLINATAHLTGSLKAPEGTVTLDARNLGVTSGPGAGLPPLNLTANETLEESAMKGTVRGRLGRARLDLSGTAPLKTTGPTDLSLRLTNFPLALVHDVEPKLRAAGVLNADAHITGTVKAPRGTINATGRGLRIITAGAGGLPPATLDVHETLLGTAMKGTVRGRLGQARLDVSGTTPLKTTGPMNLTVRLADFPLSLAHDVDPKLRAAGVLNADAHVTGTVKAPRGTVNATGRGLKIITADTQGLPPAALDAHETLLGKSARGSIRLDLGTQAHLLATGMVPLTATGAIDLTVTGRTDLRLLDPVLAAQGTRITGFITPDLRITGTAKAPLAHGRVVLADGSAQNVTSGLDLTKMSSLLLANGKQLTLSRLYAKAGNGSISGTGTIDLAPPMPVNIRIAFDRASPVQSDIISETLSGGVYVRGAVKTNLGVGGTIYIDKATVNIPKGLPPSVTKLTILKPGEKPPAPSKPPPIALNLTVATKYQGILVTGDGIFAMLGGSLHLEGTAAKPVPSGGFHLLRGHFDLAGKTLNFNKGTVTFNGNGFMPAIDFEATNTANDGTTSTLAVTGTAAHPVINLSSNPSLPSDEVLSHLLFGTGTQSLSAFQAASLAASLAQLAGIGGGGGGGPLSGVQKALGLDELSVGGGSNGSGPTVNAGRYVAPGIYVGATQSTNGGSKAKVEINLYKGLKVNTEVGSGGGYGTNTGNSVGITYQFNY